MLPAGESVVSIIGYAWWLGGEVLRSLVVWWPITLGLVAGTLVSIYRQGLPEDQQLRSLPSVLLLFPVLMILWGAAAHLDVGTEEQAAWRLAVLAVIVLFHVVMTVAVIYIARSARQQTAILAGLITWVAILCALQSTYALTGRIQPPL